MKSKEDKIARIVYREARDHVSNHIMVRKEINEHERGVEVHATRHFLLFSLLLSSSLLFFFWHEKGLQASKSLKSCKPPLPSKTADLIRKISSCCEEGRRRMCSKKALRESRGKENYCISTLSGTWYEIQEHKFVVHEETVNFWLQHKLYFPGSNISLV